MLDSLRASLDENTQRQIYNNIQQLLTGTTHTHTRFSIYGHFWPLDPLKVNSVFHLFIENLNDAKITLAYFFLLLRLLKGNLRSVYVFYNQALAQKSSELKKQLSMLFVPADPEPLRCYGSGSFYLFLKTFFLHFGFPDLSTFLSLIPVGRRPEVLQRRSSLVRSLSIAALMTCFPPAGVELHLYSGAERVSAGAADPRGRIGTL